MLNFHIAENLFFIEKVFLFVNLNKTLPLKNIGINLEKLTLFNI